MPEPIADIMPNSLPAEVCVLLAGLVSAARDALGRDVDAADQCLSCAAALIHSHAASDDRLPAVRSGGLAPWQIARLEAHIATNLARPLEVLELAAMVRISAGHFTRAFRKSFGLSPHAYVTAQRLAQAKLTMTTTSLPLVEIALACGFADQPHFCRQFRQATGETPGRWRRRHLGRHLA